MSVLLLATAKAELGTSDDDDSRLQRVINAAEAALTAEIGPLAATATTSRADGCGYALSLPVAPVISLTSVTSNTGTVISVADLSVTSGGTVQYTASSTRFPDRWYTVVYSAGRATCPENLLEAVLALTQHMWQSRRGPVRMPGSGDQIAFAAQVGALPPRVVELIEPYRLKGFA